MWKGCFVISRATSGAGTADWKSSVLDCAEGDCGEQNDGRGLSPELLSQQYTDIRC